jgi:hypothetical protein
MVWKKKSIEWKTLGILGAGRSCGVTHLSVWMSNWLTDVCHEKTAVLEWNGHGDFIKMIHFCLGEQGDTGCGEILGVNYYPASGAEELAFCMSHSYRRILIDYGEYTKERLEEWIRCDRRILLGSLSEWQSEQFLELFQMLDKMRQRWSTLVVFGSEETRRSVEKEMRRTILRVPYSVDAYMVTRTDMAFFEKLCMDLSQQRK